MNYYEILGISSSSEFEVVSATYRALMKKYHPDLWRGDPTYSQNKATLLNEAYAVLRDPEMRAKYDNERRDSNKTTQKPETADKSKDDRQQKNPSGLKSDSKYKFHESKFFPYATVGAILGIIGIINVVDHKQYYSTVEPSDDQQHYAYTAPVTESPQDKFGYCFLGHAISEIYYTASPNGSYEVKRIVRLPRGYYTIETSSNIPKCP